MSAAYYRDLLAQRERIEAFRRAIARVVRPGDRVLDVGTGLGTFAFFAADAGATKVWGVDGDPVIATARAVARANGYAGRVELIRGWLPEIELPAPVDVIIFEDLPNRLVNTRVHGLLRAVHDRYAVPGARTVPEAAEVYLAPVRSDALWRTVIPFGEGTPYGMDWTPLRALVANLPLDGSIPSGALVGEPASLGVVRFDEVPDAAALGGETVWRLAGSTTIHGLAYWFDLDLGGGERLSNAPGAFPASWGHLFLPLDPPLEAVGEVRARVHAHRFADGAPGWLSWEVTVGGRTVRGHEFAAEPASLADLQAAAPDGVPRLSPRGALEGRVLALTDGRRTIREIARQVAAEHPALAPAAAERLVARVLAHRIASGDVLATVHDGSAR